MKKIYLIGKNWKENEMKRKMEDLKEKWQKQWTLSKEILINGLKKESKKQKQNEKNKQNDDKF